ncbi:hypothetical protein ABE096_20815 [Robertmurraya massiliosenegalensis]
MVERYIELVLMYEEKLRRKLTLDEIQQIKSIVAKEFKRKTMTITN